MGSRIANMLPADRPNIPDGQKLNTQLFSEDYHVPYIVKFNGITDAATWQ